ncbi:IPT/TIG domain-containing protein [Leucobacter soli]|uniref:IPT/TIG domain-containing protein n=1 Tax=Leucobacter soli TaxID=2812850 RepID=A0A916JZV7_9MICO|nr:IPT/TIG domain-containing protein [Leucobacter soli]CAG7618438.1 hypothetical protein LEUCIP111803_02204 [Leucobacter soli]
MTQIDVKPRVFKNYRLKIAAHNLEKHVSGVTFTPTTSIQTWKGGTPEAVFSDATSPTYACQLDYAQDWETPESLALFLMEHEGELIEGVEFHPLGPTGPHFTADLIIVPGQIGGSIDAYGTATVQLGVQGKPEFSPAAPAVPVLQRLDPATGSTAGGEPVVLTGHGFLGATAVKFDGADVEHQVLTDGTVVAVAPADAAGSVDVTVTTPAGTSAPASYTYA